MQTLLRCRAAHLGRHRSASYSLRRYVADLRAATAPAVTDTTIARKRVFGVAAHIDAGKTTTCEAILHAAGALSRARMGRVDAGDTMLDYLPAERARGITISAASAAFVWGGHQIFLVDSPGHLDFTFEVERALAVMDAVVVLVDAVAGVQAQTETVWRQADRAGLARMLVVNKCDRDGARVVKVVAEARARFGVRAPVMQMAVGYPGGFEGVLDLVSMQMRAGEANGAAKLDERQMDTAREMRSELVECVAEVDDGVMQLWMDEHPVPPDVLRAAVRSAVARRELVPVFCAAALKDVGVREVMDAAVEYLPSPAERSPVTGTDDRGKRVEVSADAGGDVFVAQAFKVTHDRHRGRLVHFRAFAGALEDRKLPVWNVNTETKERPSKWLRVLADEFEEVGRVECGDVFAMVRSSLSSTMQICMRYLTSFVSFE